MATQAWAVLLGAYLLGSIPTAHLVARFFAGVDIRMIGDGNAGAKNTFESLGFQPGLVVLITDLGKGAVAVLVARQFELPEHIPYWAGACAVLGHDYPLFMRFRGGQGMAAMTGVFFALYPVQSAIGLLIFALALTLTRHWDLSCTFGFAALPLLLWYSASPALDVLYPVLMLPTIGLRKIVAVRRARRVIA